MYQLNRNGYQSGYTDRVLKCEYEFHRTAPMSFEYGYYVDDYSAAI